MKKIVDVLIAILAIAVIVMYARLYRVAKTEEYFYHRMEAAEGWR